MGNNPAHTKAPRPGDSTCVVSVESLADIVAGFKPEEIGLVRAWDEFYCACQAVSASPELLQAIHDIKESIEDAEEAA